MPLSFVVFKNAIRRQQFKTACHRPHGEIDLQTCQKRNVVFLIKKIPSDVVKKSQTFV